LGLLDGWKLCPRCGAELALDDGKAECRVCGFLFYAHSAATANAVCLDDHGRILLTRRANAPFQRSWDIPGGFLREGEHPLDGLRRELGEETGLEIEPRDFLGIWMDRYSEDESGVATLNLYWTAFVLGGDAAAADDVSELRWFGRDELPPLDELAFRCNGPVLRAFLERDPSE
jgi:8-oxo-dGTP diphosphatase